MHMTSILNRKLAKQILIVFTIILSTFVMTYLLIIGNVTSKQNELLEMLSSSLKVSIEENYRIVQQKEESCSFDDPNRLNRLLDEYSQKIKSIKKISIICKTIWINNEKGNEGDPYEPIVLYGNLDSEDFINFNLSPSQLDDVKGIKYFDVTYEGKPYKLSFMPLVEDKYICSLLSKSFFEHISLGFILHIIIISIIISLVISFIMRYELRKTDILLRSKQQRLKAIEEFKDAITNVPDYIFRCLNHSDKGILVTFNEGRLVKPEHYIGVDKQPHSLEGLYSTAFIEAVTPYLHKAFLNQQVSFEYDDNDTCYEVIVIPDNHESNTNDSVKEVICFVNDVTKYVKDIKKNSYMAYHDEVTDLCNRYRFNHDFDSFISHQKFALLYLDLDGFKSVNDQYGHNAGDYALKEIGRRLESFNSTKVYRVGGDEFLIFMPFKAQRECSRMTKNIIQSINKDIVLSTGDAVNVGVSIGISLYPNDGTDKDQLINYADQAMYHAKQEGKNTYFYYN